jgi:hypothetical protein
MTDANGDEFVRRAEEGYLTQLRGVLEPEHMGSYGSCPQPLQTRRQ